MTASTKWFICGRCGFKNHPRLAAAPSFVQAKDGRWDRVEGDTLCEQCGAANSDELSEDYQPNA